MSGTAAAVASAPYVSIATDEHGMIKPKNDEEIEELMTWPALIEDELMYEIEDDCQSPAFGQNRRILLSVLTMDSEKLFEACESSPEAFFKAFECSAPMVANLKELARILGIAHTRLMAGLCGVDMDAPDAPFTQKDFHDAIAEAKGGSS